MKEFSRRFLRREAGAVDHVDIRLRAAVADRRFVRIHFHDRVVYAHREKRGQDVFDRVDAHRSFADGGGALDRFKIVDLRVNRRLILQIFAFELDSVIDRRRLQFERDLFSCVQRGAAKSGGFALAYVEIRAWKTSCPN